MAAVVREADIVIACAGKAGVVGEGFFKEGQVVIDVGINFDEEGNMKGDVDFAAAEPVVKAITPVPGGVGTVTTSVLVKHVIEAAKGRITFKKNFPHEFYTNLVLFTLNVVCYIYLSIN
jgi:methylenetetrahydrofolate dehydrogenase (NADP+)/methenyltetrahydrofolate cyclohydrolase